MKTQWTAAACVLALCGLAGAQPLRVGRATVDITPEAGTPMGGGYTLNLSKGIHDPLACKAIALQSGEASAAIVSCDVESIHTPTVEAARALIAKQSRIPAGNVSIGATHSHSGPEMTPQVIEGATGRAGELIRRFHAGLPGKIAESVRLAEADLREARAFAARETESTISFNRRFLMKDGTVMMNPGQMNPDAVRAMGPIDPEVAVVYFATPKGEPLATLVNFALHVTVWGGEDMSADFPGVLAELLSAVKGKGMVTVFTNGCSGNINQIDAGSRHPAFGAAESRRVGTILAAAVMKAYKKLEPVEGPLQVFSERAPTVKPEFTPAEVEAAKAVIRRSHAGESIDFLTLVNATRTMNVHAYGAQPLPSEVQVITLGNSLAFAMFPGEAFVELGLLLKMASPFRFTIINELSNGMLDYFPDRKAYDEGGYEPTTARCVQGCGETLVETARSLLVRAYRNVSALRPQGDNRRVTLP